MQPSTSIVSSAEAERKREAALDAAGPFATSDPATVRWLLCGRGRPVDVASPSPYVVAIDEDGGRVYYQDIERSRVEREERWEELGYEPVSYPWYEPPPVALRDVETAVAPLRRALSGEDADRYRAAGTAAAAAMVATLARLTPELTELEAAAILAFEARRHGFVPVVDLAAGEERQPLHRHPLPSAAPLGRHGLLAITAERDGLHLSLTRLFSFGEPPRELVELLHACAEVDAAMLAASRPGVTTGEVLDVAARAYAEQGFPCEWRRHHQGGITGYRGREVFATPAEPTRLPALCAVAWNPSIAGGAKSEDTALVFTDGVEVITRTPSLAELEVDGLARPAVSQL